MQLVIADRTQVTASLSSNILSTPIWRVSDLSVQLDYLLVGFGWCNIWPKPISQARWCGLGHRRHHRDCAPQLVNLGRTGGVSSLAR